MISASPYKGKRISPLHAIKEIENNKGSQFDPGVVHAFMEIMKKPQFRNMTGVIS